MVKPAGSNTRVRIVGVVGESSAIITRWNCECEFESHLSYHTSLETCWSIGLGSGLQILLDGFDSHTCLPSSMKIVVDIRLRLI